MKKRERKNKEKMNLKRMKTLFLIAEPNLASISFKNLKKHLKLCGMLYNKENTHKFKTMILHYKEFLSSKNLKSKSIIKIKTCSKSQPKVDIN